MKVQWVEKNVDLQLLSKFVETFFLEKGFKTVTTQKSADFKIQAYLPIESLAVEAKIAGRPNDFTVELNPKGSREGLLKMGLMTLPFGGGNLILRELKLQEKFRKLEDEFWVYIEKAVCNLANSFSH